MKVILPFKSTSDLDVISTRTEPKKLAVSHEIRVTVNNSSSHFNESSRLQSRRYLCDTLFVAWSFVLDEIPCFLKLRASRRRSLYLGFDNSSFLDETKKTEKDTSWILAEKGDFILHI